MAHRLVHGERMLDDLGIVAGVEPMSQKLNILRHGAPSVWGGSGWGWLDLTTGHSTPRRVNYPLGPDGQDRTFIYFPFTKNRS